MDLSPTTSLLGDDTVEGAVDYRGRPVLRSRTGRWRSAILIIGVEIAERFAFYGIESNLISYLTGPLHQSTARAATNVNVWYGTSTVLPLLGAFVADSYLGRYRMIIASTLLYLVGLAFLTLSATLPPLRPPDCINPKSCPSPTPFQVLFFFTSLYIVALAQGGHRPCVQAFGADQFDPRDPKESKSRSSFFNWWYFALQSGILVSLWIVTYIQDNVSWGLGFGIPCIAMAAALFIFLVGTFSYRHLIVEDENSFGRIAFVIASAARQRFRRAMITNKDDGDQARSDLTAEEKKARGLVPLAPIWATCLIFAVVFAQTSTLFTKQAATMIRKVGPNFEIPAASLQMFICFAVMLVLPLYDRVLVPVMRSFTNIQSGISMLQRIGVGIFISSVAMVVAAVVETQRLEVAQDTGSVDAPGGRVPMSVGWLIPQYILCGVADALTMVGLQEFFYGQVPDRLRSVGLALYLSIFGIGNFLSGFLISAIDKVSGAHGESWFATDINRAHLDYFYWLLAALNTLGLGIFVYFSRSYIYKTKAEDE
ncbi:protein NRT1/ PTR FAMILY 5.10-like [Aristolochia californica]|uniref:protein NRT1/ PTR FAMILY 5.10-like n=1 Tax=Aristolochia californica TaxID=171875 RepID=UPI0035DBCD34